MKQRSHIPVLVALGLALMLPPFAIDLYLPGLPSMAQALNASLSQAEATIALFLVSFAVGQLLTGAVIDSLGRRRTMIAGLVLFSAASALAAITDTMAALFALRLLQAAGLATTVGALPIVRDLLGADRSKAAISWIMAGVVIAPLLAPIAGGALTALFGWRSLFTALAILGLAAVLLISLTVPASTAPAPQLRLKDLTAGYITILADDRIMRPVASAALAFGALFAFVTAAPSIYMVQYGASPSAFGVLFGANACAMLLANLANTHLVRELTSSTIIKMGTLLMTISTLSLCGLLFVEPPLWLLVGTIFMHFIGIGLVETNAAIQALSVSPSHNGAVAALFGAGQFGVGALASSVVSSGFLPPLVSVTAIMTSAVLGIIVLNAAATAKGTA